MKPTSDLPGRQPPIPPRTRRYQAHLGLIRDRAAICAACNARVVIRKTPYCRCRPGIPLEEMLKHTDNTCRHPDRRQFGDGWSKLGEVVSSQKSEVSSSAASTPNPQLPSSISSAPTP